METVFFLGISADSGRGIHAETNSNVDISGNTIFIGNSGGGVYAHFNSNINISGNTTFIGNSARNGGGIYARFGSNINISGNTTFINNSVSGKYPDGKGGGIHASDYSNIIINGNTNFINNTAKKNGGGIYTECANNINIGGNTTFISNSASGGVYKIGHFGIADLFSPRGFTMKSGRGGGIYTSGHCESGEHSQIKLGMGLYVVIDHMLHKIQLNNEVEIPLSSATLLIMEEEYIYCTITIRTSLETPFLLVTQLQLGRVEESMQESRPM